MEIQQHSAQRHNEKRSPDTASQAGSGEYLVLLPKDSCKRHAHDREAAYALCTYVDSADGDFDPPFVGDRPLALGVIELGSGTGVVAASVARTLRRTSSSSGFVIATDLPDVCPLLQHNLGITPRTSMADSDLDVVFVRPLAWGNLDHAIAIANEFGTCRLTHVVCSDLASTLCHPETVRSSYITSAGVLSRTLWAATSHAHTPHLTALSGAGQDCFILQDS